MSDYGVISTGFNRKPLAVIQAEIEASLVTEFGPQVIQTSQSPLGQLNGLMADIIAELWEVAEDVYQSYDPLEAEGSRLDTLGAVRNLKRSSSELDPIYRASITNEDTARITYADFNRALKSVDGVTYAQVFVNELPKTDDKGMPANTVSAAVLGGDDAEVARVVDRFLVPGISMYGNNVVNTNFAGYCRAISFVRPTEVPTTFKVYVTTESTRKGCPAPAPAAIANALLAYVTAAETRPWNGEPIDDFYLRKFIESNFAGVKYVALQGYRDSESDNLQGKLSYNFFEIADVDSVSVVIA